MPSPYPSTMIPPKKPELNGGLYTGEPFRGPWGNVPVLPDVLPMTKETLLLQSVPHTPGSTEQFDPFMLRPGNNAPLPLKEEHPFSQQHSFHCTAHKGGAGGEARIRSYDPIHEVGAAWR